MKWLLAIFLITSCKCAVEPYYGVATYKTDSGENLYTCTEINPFDNSQVNYLKICTDLKECNDFCAELRKPKK